MPRTFSSTEQALLFADIRSVVSTARKQSRNLLGTLAEMFRAPGQLGDSLVDGAKN
ncbi:MAG: hypothetical protein WD342_07215 [Verrucomicrobiales bacterium]